MTIGTMIAFVSYAQMFIWPIREVGRVLTELGKTLVAIGRIKEVLDVPEETMPRDADSRAARVLAATSSCRTSASSTATNGCCSDVSL